MFTLTPVSHYPKIGDTLEEQLLRRSLTQFDRKEIDEAELEHVKDTVTRQVIEEQVEAGMEIVTDGQIRWNDPLTSCVILIPPLFTASRSAKRSWRPRSPWWSRTSSLPIRSAPRP